MTAPTPPLVDVIAEVLRVHVKSNIKGCDCGWAELGKDHRDHQARAVLDALLSDEAVERAAKATAGIAGAWPHQYTIPDDFYRTSTAADRYRTRARAALMAALEVEG